MWAYAWATVLIFVENSLPAFSPPTWLVLVYLTLDFDLEPFILIPIAVVMACAGHWFMANGIRRARNRLPKQYVANLNNLGAKITQRGASTWGLLALFLWSPLSSGQLFAAAGLMPQVRLLPLTLAFGAGRVFTYSTYVLGAHAFAETDFGAQLVSEMTSPGSLALQTLLLLGLVGLGFIRWQSPTDQSANTGE